MLLFGRRVMIHFDSYKFLHASRIPNKGRIPGNICRVQTGRISIWTYSKADVYRGTTVYGTCTVYTLHVKTMASENLKWKLPSRTLHYKNNFSWISFTLFIDFSSIQHKTSLHVVDDWNMQYLNLFSWIQNRVSGLIWIRFEIWWRQLNNVRNKIFWQFIDLHITLIFLIFFVFCFLICAVGLSVLRPLTGLLYQPRMIGDGDCGEIGGMKLSRGNRSTRRKSAPAPLLSITKSRMTRPGFEPGPPWWEASD
jgi:hypothetical protein